MKQFFKKLLLGSNTVEHHPKVGALQKRVNNLRSIWTISTMTISESRRFSAYFCGFVPILLFRHLHQAVFWQNGIAYQDLSVEILCSFKVCFPLWILYADTHDNPILFFLVIWFLLETMLYVTTLIFASDIFSRPRSYRRSMLLLFFNYMEIVLSFGVIYARSDYFNKPFLHWFDPAYFSFITSASIGYGDFYPITAKGKLAVSIQSVIYLIFVVLFVNFFTNKVENQGYFDHKNKS